MDENAISKRVISAAIEVHKHLGPSLPESVYQQCMVRALRIQDTAVETELLLKGEYKGLCFDIDYRMDMLVGQKVVVELKVVESLLPVHKAQLLSYMKLSGIKLGLLINLMRLWCKTVLSELLINCSALRPRRLCAFGLDIKC